MLTLHHNVQKASDQFVLSKGHSAGAYYITLWTLGKLDDDDLRQFHLEPIVESVPLVNRFGCGSFLRISTQGDK